MAMCFQFSAFLYALPGPVALKWRCHHWRDSVSLSTLLCTQGSFEMMALPTTPHPSAVLKLKYQSSLSMRSSPTVQSSAATPTRSHMPQSSECSSGPVPALPCNGLPSQNAFLDATARTKDHRSAIRRLWWCQPFVSPMPLPSICASP